MDKSCTLRRLLGVIAIVTAGAACTTHQNEAPSLTGPSDLTQSSSTPTVRFSFSPAAPLANLDVAFDGSASCAESATQTGCASGRITSYRWNFGDDTTADGSQTSHRFATAGTFSVTLSVVNDRGLASVTTRQIVVGAAALPIAAFVSSPSAPQVGESVSFVGSSSTGPPGHSIVRYTWNFGDGGTAAGETSSHTFRTAGTYNVVLDVTDDLGQHGATTRAVTVTPPLPTSAPTAAFVFSPTAPLVNQSVLFNAAASKAAAGHSLVNYDWNFGDGGTGGGVTPSHSFGTAGTYNVVLTVTDDVGLTATTTQPITVGTTSASPPPTAAFVFSPTAPQVNQSVLFNAGTSHGNNGHNIVGYAWNFGDGGTAGGVTPSHPFTTAGTYSVVLTVTDDIGQTGTISQAVTVGSGGATPPTAAFVFSPTAPQVNQPVLFNAGTSHGNNGHAIVGYAWNFGDGGTASGVTPSHPFTTAGTYNVVLTVTDDIGQTGTATQGVTVGAGSTTPPTASFVFSPSAPQVNQSVLFNAGTSHGNGGHSIVGYAWNFGDGGTATGVTPSHPFATAGTYNVVLTVTDDIGQTGSTTQPVTVSPINGGVPPTASFVFSPSAPGVNQVVTFNASASAPGPGRTISSYAWDFGDGTGGGTGVTTTHVYTRTGTFVVTLVVTDDINQTGTTTRNVTVSSTSGQMVAEFTFSPTDPAIAQTVFFDGSPSIPSPGTTIVSYTWDFGDGTPGSGQKPTHVFLTANTFVVRLTILDSSGKTATVTHNVAVK